MRAKQHTRLYEVAGIAVRRLGVRMLVAACDVRRTSKRQFYRRLHTSDNRKQSMPSQVSGRSPSQQLKARDVDRSKSVRQQKEKVDLEVHKEYTETVDCTDRVA